MQKWESTFHCQPFSTAEENSKNNTCFLLGDVKLHKYYFSWLAKLLKTVFMFKKPEGGTQRRERMRTPILWGNLLHFK